MLHFELRSTVPSSDDIQRACVPGPQLSHGLNGRIALRVCVVEPNVVHGICGIGKSEREPSPLEPVVESCNLVRDPIRTMK